MDIFAREVSGNTMAIHLETNATVARAIEEIKSTSPALGEFDLYFAGRHLSNTGTMLTDYQISNDAVLMIVARVQ